MAAKARKSNLPATLSESLKQLSINHPDKEVYVTYNRQLERSSLRAAECYTLATRFAKILKDAGLEKGDIVVNSLPPCLEEVVTSFGVILAGGVNVGVEVFLNTGDTFFEVVDKCKPKILITSQLNHDKVWGLVKKDVTPTSGDFPIAYNCNSVRGPSLKQVLAVGRDAKTDLLKLLRGTTKDYVCESVSPGDVCVGLTTANSKSFVCLVMHTHSSIINDSHNFTTQVVKPGMSTYLHTKPPTWANSNHGLYMADCPTRVGIDDLDVVDEDEHFQLFVDILQNQLVDVAFMVAPDIVKMMGMLRPTSKHIVKQLLTAGMPLSKKVVAQIFHCVGTLTNYYMCTEHLFMCSYHIQSVDQFQEFDVGVPMPGTDVLIVDKQFKEVAVGVTGAVLVKSNGATTFHHYQGQPIEDYKEKFTKEGYYIVGDAGRKGANGHVFIMGRNDDMIMHNLYNVHPSTIEKHIKSHPHIEKVVVVPIPDDENIQNICACVIRKAGKSVTVEEVKDYFRANYQDGEKDILCPSEVLFMDTFPESQPGRVDRNKLAAVAENLLK